MLATIVLAAGEGTRMRSKQVKVLHSLLGKSMIRYVLETVAAIGTDRLIVVVGRQEDKVRQELADFPCQFVPQPQRLGTGNAVLQAKNMLADFEGDVLILHGDTPLLKAETIKELVAEHTSHKRRASMLTAKVAEPRGYGRIIRGKSGEIIHIVEEKDASPTEKEISEINTGIYCFEKQLLFTALAQLTPANAQQEYYLTDVISICQQQGITVSGTPSGDPVQIMGINNREELAQASRLIRRKIITEWLLAGVTIIDPENTFIERDVTIGQDTVIYPYTFLLGKTVIGEDCVVGPFSQLRDVTVEAGVTIHQSCVLDSARIESEAIIGPFARLRPGSIIKHKARVGNFVELKKSSLGAYSKANHLSYLGDTTIGEEVNIGAGTITCNYDGQKKHKTTIDKEVFIGSGTQLIAPVTIGEGAIIGAGSTISKDVAPHSLALTRAKELHKDNWAKRRKNDQDKHSKT